MPSVHQQKYVRGCLCVFKLHNLVPPSPFYHQTSRCTEWCFFFFNRYLFGKRVTSSTASYMPIPLGDISGLMPGRPPSTACLFRFFLILIFVLGAEHTSFPRVDRVPRSDKGSACSSPSTGRLLLLYLLRYSCYLYLSCIKNL